jgi:hypothetical protein
VMLVVSIVVGLLIAGPRRVLLSRWLWAGAAIAFVVGFPNLLYQITNGWPELAMARALSAEKGANARATFVPLQLILVGLTLTPIWVAGVVRLLRDRAWRPVRALAFAYIVAAGLTVLTGGQPYYTYGLLAALYAAGCVVAARWAAGHRGRWLWLAAALVVNAVAGIPLALPIFPLRSLPPAIAAVNQATRDSVGWPAYVQEVAAVYRGLPPAEQSKAVLVTGNYGEAGALDRFGPRYRLPPVFSGQNQLYDYGPPPQWATVAVLVGVSDPSASFSSCQQRGTLDDRVGVQNEEQGQPIFVCVGPRLPWSKLWPSFQHYS